MKPSTAREFEELLSEHLDGLYSSALRFCAGRSADAEDLLQDAVFRAFRHFDDLRDPTAARAWFYTILARTNLNRLRTRRRRAETLAPDLDDDAFEAALAEWRPVQVPDEYADGALARQRLTAALDRLDDDVRAVIWLSDVEGFRQREVADMLDIPEGTVASRLFRARRALRGLLASGRADMRRAESI
ncbi:MAG TPA: sigma-70 family RNA polymerase sigma factor [Gemmatimonadaceae bacterium]|jgi:RNA polymerase sigma-70 factor (ECF subfamily)|nr:sigma-70 family RNA polymerase sigma factor [Gemmatimonadaceae bacterium]